MTTAQNVYAPTGAVPTARYAGFGVRLLAYLIDMVILFVIFAVFIFISIFVGRAADPGNLATGTGRSIGNLACGVIGLVYFLYFWGSKGATPGKKLLHLRVRLQNQLTGDAGIGQGRAFIRLIGYAINSVFLYLPFLIILTNKEKRGLHDFIAGTEVVRE